MLSFFFFFFLHTPLTELEPRMTTALDGEGGRDNAGGADRGTYAGGGRGYGELAAGTCCGPSAGASSAAAGELSRRGCELLLRTSSAAAGASFAAAGRMGRYRTRIVAVQSSGPAAPGRHAPAPLRCQELKTVAPPQISPCHTGPRCRRKALAPSHRRYGRRYRRRSSRSGVCIFAFRETRNG